MAERTSFTPTSAQRIANAVRSVENARSAAQALSSRRAFVESKPKVFRVCTFTGAWAIGETRTVTFKYQTATPNTVSATNLFFPVTGEATSTRDCAVAKDGTAWFLIDVPLATATVVVDITLSASLNTSACTITIGKTLVTGSSTFLRL